MRNQAGCHRPRSWPRPGHRRLDPAMVAGDCFMDFVSSTPQSAVLTITPELAAKLLQSSPGNRRIRGWYVSMLAAAMKSGNWMVTSQGVGINTRGELRDAHHRLTACVQANVPFPTVVVWGLPEEAYQVTDRGLTRSYEDILMCPKPVAEVLRHAAHLMTNSNRPSVHDINPLVQAGIGSATTALVEFCPSKRAYYSCAIFKLAAIIRIAEGVDADFVYSQYKALVMADYDAMTNASKALTRQVTTNKLSVTNKHDVLARGLVVFDPKKQSISKVQIDDEKRISAARHARNVLTRLAAGW